MTNPSQPSGQIADTSAVLALSRRAGRQYSLYFVMLGAAALVTGFLLWAMSWKVAIPVGLVIVAICVYALGRFVSGHRSLVGQLNHLARPFWVVYLLALLAAMVGTVVWQQHQWVGLAGGAVGLLDGLVTGHFVDRASRAATEGHPGARVH